DVSASVEQFLLIDEPRTVEGRYHPKDRHMVAAAAAANGCYLATVDQRLRTALNQEEIPQRFGFRVIDLEEAAIILRAPDREES
ncbi:MAG: hypothetical protein JOZ41_01205, partial [Chloroflexi bacterium]|nr:hypothetical protein [Chloroflexota bacterium]